MRLIACATTKHSFDMGHGSEQLVFDGHALELEDDVAAHLLAESPQNFTDETPPAVEDEHPEAPETEAAKE